MLQLPSIAIPAKPPAIKRAPSRPDWPELLGIAVTVAIHLFLMALLNRPSALFIGGACLFWIGFVLVRAHRDGGVFAKWGFHTANLLPAALSTGIVFAVAAGAMAAYASWNGALRFPLYALLLFLLYPIWGVIQQFLALGIVVQNLERISFLGRRRFLIVLIGAALFGLVHAYDWRLALGTALLELVVVPLYLRYRNLWPLGVLHGWLGALFYLWVLNYDLWAEVLCGVR